MKATHTLPADVVVTPADLLRCAAVYIRGHGWTQGSFYDVTSDDPFPAACALGAIRIASFGGIDTPPTSGRCEGTHRANIASRVLAVYLDDDYRRHEISYIDVIGDWNDHDSRTADEVITALNDAADEWDRLHTPGGAR